MFLAVEGGEGAGKTTAIAALARHLTGQGREVVTTNEPGGTPQGLALRALLLSADAAWEAESELLLMTAARVEHVRRVIRPALARGAVVLCDRYLGSTRAYQGAGRGLDDALILDLHRRFVGLDPDVTVLLDIDVETGLARSRARLADTGADESRFEALDLQFHTRVRQSFLSQAAEARWLVIEAAVPAAEVAESMIALNPGRGT